MAAPLLHELMTTVAAGVVVCDARAPDQPIVQVNRAFTDITGYDADDAIGRNCRFLQGPDTDPAAVAQLHSAVRSGATLTATLLNYRRDRSTFHNEIRLSPVRDDDGELRWLIGVLTDVSERARSRSALALSEALRASVFNAILDGVVVLDSAGAVIDANPRAQEILGMSSEELHRADWWARLRIRRPDGSPVAPDQSPRLVSVRERRRLLGVRLLVRRGDGADRLLSLGYEPLPDDEHGRPSGLVTTLRDETDRIRAEEELQRFASLVELSGDFIGIADLDGTVTYINEAGRRLVGLESLQEGRRIRIPDLLTDQGRLESTSVEQPAVLEHGHWEGEGTLRHLRTGAPIPVRISSYLVRHPQTGEPMGLATVQRDITAEHAATAELVASRERYEAQFRSVPLPVLIWKRQGDDFVLAEWNQAAIEFSRGAIAEHKGALASVFFHDEPQILLALERCFSTRAQVRYEGPYRMRTTGEHKHLERSFAWVPPDLVLTHLHDLTHRAEAERQLVYLTEHDDLTGLHNRRYFERRLTAALASARPVAVLIVDVDHFKFVNDSLGHKAGDELLREVAAAMAIRLRDGDTLARFGGDEFAILLAECDQARATAVANHMLAAVRSSVTGVSVTASCGAAVFQPGGSLTASDAIVAADIALYEAKERGRDRTALYSGQAGHNLTWLERIRAAIARDRLVLYGQRTIALRDPDEPPRYELLVRMQDEHGGTLIPPSSFLPIAEQFGLVREIDRWVVARGIELAARGTLVALNLSARSLGDPKLPDLIADKLAQTGARPSDVAFEFTETAAISSVDDARALTLALTELGCGTALDDFGTGFASFVLLKHLPVTSLKIDTEFVRGLSSSEQDQRIVRAIVRIANEAGMTTVAEGVEDAGALALLREYGVDFAQGFHIGRPEPLPS
ncbi:MAG: sensor domain-containing protein [Solirubrobacteraceae bacterium]